MAGTINSLAALAFANGHRQRVAVPNTQWLTSSPSHPFRVGALLKNGSQTNSDLTTQDAWYEDVQVRTAYTPTDGATGTKLRAILQVDAVRVYVSSSAFSALDASVKDDVNAQIFLEADVGGVLKRVDLRGAIREPPSQFQITQAEAADGQHWLLRGGWVEVPGGPFAVDLESNNMYLKTLNAPTLGADIPCWVEFIGDMTPKGYGTPYVPGGACGPGSQAVADLDVLREQADGIPQLAAYRSWEGG